MGMQYSACGSCRQDQISAVQTEKGGVMRNMKYGQTSFDAEIRRRTQKKKRRKRLVRFALLLVPAAVLLRPSVSGRIRQLLGRLKENGGEITMLRSEPDRQQPLQESEAEVPVRPQKQESDSTEPNEELLAVMRESALQFEAGFDFETAITGCSTSDQLFEAVYAAFGEMMRRNPELFWISGVHPSVTLWGDNAELSENARVDFIISDAFSGRQPEEMYREMKQEAARILDAAPKTGSDYEKALFVHDYLVEHTVYDLEGYLHDDRLIYTAYGALVNHAAVCNGYAAAYQYLLRELGVNCMFASGTVRESARSELAKKYIGGDGGHSWNCVELDGKYYWVDVTWDDPLDQNGQEIGGPVKREYCFVEDNKIFETRILSEEYADLPVCQSMKLNDQLMEADRKNAGK